MMPRRWPGALLGAAAVLAAGLAWPWPAVDHAPAGSIRGAAASTIRLRPPSGDRFAAQVVLAVRAGTPDGSTSIVDASPRSQTITRYGDAQSDTGYTVGAYPSVLSDGAGDYLTVPGSSDFDLRGGVDSTIEVWARWSADRQLFLGYANAGASGASDYWDIGVGSDWVSTNKIVWRYAGGTSKLVSASTYSAGAWHYVRASSCAGVLRMEVDGSLAAGPVTAQYGVNIPNGKHLAIGANLYGGGYYSYLSGNIYVRITRACRYGDPVPSAAW